MARVESMPTHELWGISEEQWITYLTNSGSIDVLINYYEIGISMMEAINRDVLGTHRYSEIVGTDLERGLAKREKTIEFYRLRLKELEGKDNE